MSDIASDPRKRFLERIDRRLRCLKSLHEAGLGVFLPADERQRARAIEQFVRMTARTSELPHLSANTLAEATETIRSHLEAMQPLLPHDVQYRNRIRRNW